MTLVELDVKYKYELSRIKLKRVCALLDISLINSDLMIEIAVEPHYWAYILLVLYTRLHLVDVESNREQRNVT